MDPSRRIGYGPGGLADLLSHPFFASRGIAWDAVRALPAPAPYPIPPAASRAKAAIGEELELEGGGLFGPGRGPGAALGI